jgi:hypothetical protein
MVLEKSRLGAERKPAQHLVRIGASYSLNENGQVAREIILVGMVRSEGR